MKVIFEKKINYEDYTINGLEILVQSDQVYLQIGSSFVVLEKEEAQKLSALLSL